MSLTNSVWIRTAAGTILLTAGLTASAHGALTEDVPRSLGGVCLTTTALTLIALARIRSWVFSTNNEREQLAEARREAEAERRRFFAAQAALEGETTRLTRDVSVERARIAATLATEREAMRAEFEKNRLQVATEAFRSGVEMERAGLLKPDAPTPQANLIPFPGARAPERERSREHGVVGP